MTNKILFSFVFMFLIASTNFAQSKGQNLPSISIKDLNGKDVDVSKFSESGKITVISFWATWCTPCKKELNNAGSRKPGLHNVIDILGWVGQNRFVPVYHNWALQQFWRGKAALSLSGADRDQVTGAGCQCCRGNSIVGCDGGCVCWRCGTGTVWFVLSAWLPVKCGGVNGMVLTLLLQVCRSWFYWITNCLHSVGRHVLLSQPR